jgi:F0F1-type ATP synthase membrane subunit c/vacuolar-type H+-ATPase subunit K
MAFMVLFVALIEVIAIYGLIISLKVLNDASNKTTTVVEVIE